MFEIGDSIRLKINPLISKHGVKFCRVVAFEKNRIELYDSFPVEKVLEKGLTLSQYWIRDKEEHEDDDDYSNDEEEYLSVMSDVLLFGRYVCL